MNFEFYISISIFLSLLLFSLFVIQNLYILNLNQLFKEIESESFMLLKNEKIFVYDFGELKKIHFTMFLFIVNLFGIIGECMMKSFVQLEASFPPTNETHSTVRVLKIEKKRIWNYLRYGCCEKISQKIEFFFCFHPEGWCEFWSKNLRIYDDYFCCCLCEICQNHENIYFLMT